MTNTASRREFLKRGSALSLAGAAAPWALNLAAIGEAAAQSATDYKALVCVFLFGGNDHGNTVVPYDSATHASYSSLRGTLATARAALTPTLLVPAIAMPAGTDAQRLQRVQAAVLLTLGAPEFLVLK